MNIRDFDLNLLLALDALLDERHVTRAARRLKLSQPAMSNALARLRALLDDPLLVRGPHGMMPTPRAERLEPLVREALQAVERAVADPAEFSPARMQATFDLMTSDAIGMLLLPRLTEGLRTTATGISLRLHGPMETEPWEALEAGRMHLVAGVYEAPRAGIQMRELYTEEFVCVLRKDHPRGPQPLSVEDYAALPHLLVATSRNGAAASPVDRALAERGLQRRVALLLPSFLLAPFVVAESDCVVTFPRRLAEYFAAFLPVQLLEPPLPLPGYPIRLFWHTRSDRDPASRWLRDAVAEAARPLCAPAGG